MSGKWQKNKGKATLEEKLFTTVASNQTSFITMKNQEELGINLVADGQT